MSLRPDADAGAAASVGGYDATEGRTTRNRYRPWRCHGRLPEGWWCHSALAHHLGRVAMDACLKGGGATQHCRSTCGVAVDAYLRGGWCYSGLAQKPSQRYSD